jgi:hypothetical protein
MFRDMKAKNAELLQKIAYEKEKGRTLSKNIIELMQAILDVEVDLAFKSMIKTELDRYAQLQTEDEKDQLMHEWSEKIPAKNAKLSTEIDLNRPKLR